MNRAVSASACRVFVPTTPSTRRPARRWKRRTARRVARPNRPSARWTRKPWRCSACWTARTRTLRLPFVPMPCLTTSARGEPAARAAVSGREARPSSSTAPVAIDMALMPGRRVVTDFSFRGNGSGGHGARSRRTGARVETPEGGSAGAVEEKLDAAGRRDHEAHAVTAQPRREEQEAGGGGSRTRRSEAAPPAADATPPAPALPGVLGGWCGAGRARCRPLWGVRASAAVDASRVSVGRDTTTSSRPARRRWRATLVASGSAVAGACAPNGSRPAGRPPR